MPDATVCKIHLPVAKNKDLHSSTQAAYRFFHSFCIEYLAEGVGCLLRCQRHGATGWLVCCKLSPTRDQAALWLCCVLDPELYELNLQKHLCPCSLAVHLQPCPWQLRTAAKGVKAYMLLSLESVVIIIFIVTATVNVMRDADRRITISTDTYAH